MGVNEIVAVVCVALTAEASVTARPLMPVIKGNVPVAVVSMMTGLPAAKSFEVPAAMLANAACPAVGVVNFVIVTVMMKPKNPAVSFTVSTEAANATEQVGLPDAGTVTAQTLVPSKAMPAPDSVMAIPALAPAVMIWTGMNEIVAVVCVALTLEASVTARSLMPDTKGNIPSAVVSMMTGLPTEKSFEVPAAMMFDKGRPMVDANFVTVTTTGLNGLKAPPAVNFTVSTEAANATEQAGLPDAGAVTAQALVASKVTPNSVILIPALAPAVMACVGVKEIVVVL